MPNEVRRARSRIGTLIALLVLEQLGCSVQRKDASSPFPETVAGANAAGMDAAGISGAGGAGMGAGMSAITGGTGGTPTGTPDSGMVTPTPDSGVMQADAGNAADAGGDGERDAEAPKPPCLTKASQVILIGDSYINWVSHTFPADLNKEAGQTFRMYAVGGFAMGSGGIGLIPPQLDQAVMADPDITTIVMTGGGNDVLVADAVKFPQGGECKNSAMSASIPDCQEIVATALEAAEKTIDHAVEVGVKDVVYFFYPPVPEGTLVGGAHPNAILEYSLPMVRDFCDGVADRTGGDLTCHFVDMTPVFAGHLDYFAPTDIHPNLQGSAAMAKAVWQKMKDNCVAQPASSGCCEP